MKDTVDFNKHFIQKPGIAYFATTLSNQIAISLTELKTPVSDSFITDGNTPCCEKLFDVSKAQSISVIKPNSVANNLSWVAISGIDIFIFHAVIIA